MKLGTGIPHQLEIPGFMPPYDRTVNADGVRTTLQLADELGFDNIGASEHFIIPRDHVARSGAWYHHALVALGVAAGMTRRIKLTTAITILPLQHAIVQAKAWSTLDWLSNGRAIPTVAVGWLKEEFDMLGVPFDERGAMCDEYVAAMIELWTKDDPVFEGKYVKFRDVAFGPKPIQKPYPPLWFGGDAKPVLRRIARWGDGWAPFLTKPHEVRECLDFIKSQPDYHGRPIGLRYSMHALTLGEGHVATGSTSHKIEPWNAAQAIDLCGRLAELGATETSIPQPEQLETLEAYHDWMRWVAAEIIPKVAHL